MSNLAQSVSDVTMAGAATLNPIALSKGNKKSGVFDMSAIGSHVIDVSPLTHLSRFHLFWLVQITSGPWHVHIIFSIPFWPEADVRRLLKIPIAYNVICE